MHYMVSKRSEVISPFGRAALGRIAEAYWVIAYWVIGISDEDAVAIAAGIDPPITVNGLGPDVRIKFQQHIGTESIYGSGLTFGDIATKRAKYLNYMDRKKEGQS